VDDLAYDIWEYVFEKASQTGELWLTWEESLMLIKDFNIQYVPIYTEIPWTLLTPFGTLQIKRLSGG